jgi:nucleoside-diphosphate-sugar epimerase
MIVFVAGGTGAVGRLMVPLLVAAGHTVHVLTRRPDLVGQLEAAGAHGIVGDVFDGPRGHASPARRVAGESRPAQRWRDPSRQSSWRGRLQVQIRSLKNPAALPSAICHRP